MNFGVQKISFMKKKNISAATRGSDQYIYKDLNVIKIKNISELEKKYPNLVMKL